MKPLCTNPQWQGRAKCSVCEVRNLVLFSALTEDELAGILQPIDNLHAPEHARLYERGTAAGHLYTVRGGVVKLVTSLPNGDQRIVRLLRPGDVAGLEALVDGVYHHDAVVLRAADVCRIPVEVVRELDRKSPGLHRELMARWQRAVDQADHFIASLSTGTAEARLARLLLYIACERTGELSVVPGREDMGALIGVTTETASRVMAEFKRQGLLREEKGSCVTCDRLALERIARG